jgi:hypothetical protein
MRIGDTVIYRGRAYVLRGLDPMGVPDRRADIEDAAAGRLLRVRIAELEPGRRRFNPVRAGYTE